PSVPRLRSVMRSPFPRIPLPVHAPAGSLEGAGLLARPSRASLPRADSRAGWRMPVFVSARPHVSRSPVHDLPHGLPILHARSPVHGLATTYSVHVHAI